jgi:Protein of unknown function (DUF3160)
VTQSSVLATVISSGKLQGMPMRQLTATVLLLLALTIQADAETGSGWRVGLDPDLAARLERDGIAVLANRPLRQVFRPYIAARRPVFVTSDAVLAGYHSLFEESVIRIERDRAAHLPEVLSRLLKSLDAQTKSALVKPPLDEALGRAAHRRVRLTIATAEVLLAGNPTFASESDESLVRQQAARIERAEGTSIPAWLGPPTDGFLELDHARFRPRGPYDRDEALRRYFRAVSWLQAIPFRMNHEEEVLAMLLLREAFKERVKSGVRPVNPADRERALREARKLNCLRGYPRLLAPGDDPYLSNLPLAPDLPVDGKMLTVWLEKIREDARSPWIQDQLATSLVSSLRILPAGRLPDSALFTATSLGLPQSGPRMPSPLEVTSVLGCAWSRARLAKAEGKSMLLLVDGMRDAFAAENLYAETLRCLAALLDPAEPDAPDLFRGEAWKVKSAQTALSSWALLRHTWVLQAKGSESTTGMTDDRAGYVEPDPEFFGRLHRLTVRTHRLLTEEGAVGIDGSRARVARALVDLTRSIRERGLPLAKKEWIGCGRHSWMRTEFLFRTLGLRSFADLKEHEKEDALRRLSEFCDHLLDPGRTLGAELERALRWMETDLQSLWRRLEVMTARLECLAHKQLRGAPLNESDEEFLKGFGMDLANVMQYESNSGRSPNDDALRVVDVHYHPQQGLRLLVGVARPRLFLVLYPWKGRKVLCQGSVLSYRELTGPKPLTNAEWKTMLDGDAPPVGPAWRHRIEAGR